MHRVFLAIPLPLNTQQKFSAFQKLHPELPARWTQPENLHITLQFLGNRTDKEIADICSAVSDAASRHKAFTLTLSNISYGPPGKTPRMVWATGESTEEFQALARELAMALSIKATPVTLHITLARIIQWKFRQLEEEERPDVEQKLSLSIPVSSVQVMESQLKRTGPTYTILQETHLQ